LSWYESFTPYVYKYPSDCACNKSADWGDALVEARPFGREHGNLLVDRGPLCLCCAKLALLIVHMQNLDTTAQNKPFNR
jgi:hypothetical protein